MTARHVAAVTNVDADFASRNVIDRTEWTLERDIFRKITQRYYAPEVDLFFIANKQPVAPLCSEVSRFRFHSDRCFSSELEPVDGVYSFSDSAIAKDSSKNTPRPNNRASDSPDVAGIALVPSPTRDASALSSSIASSREDTRSSIQSRTTSDTSTSDTSTVEHRPFTRGV